MSNEKPIPWTENPRAQRLYEILLDGPHTTLDLLQRQFIHPARQVWELRHWYGVNVVTGRLPNRVAIYSIEPTR